MQNVTRPQSYLHFQRNGINGNGFPNKCYGPHLGTAASSTNLFNTPSFSIKLKFPVQTSQMKRNDQVLSHARVQALACLRAKYAKNDKRFSPKHVRFPRCGVLIDSAMTFTSRVVVCACQPRHHYALPSIPPRLNPCTANSLENISTTFPVSIILIIGATANLSYQALANTLLFSTYVHIYTHTHIHTHSHPDGTHTQTIISPWVHYMYSTEARHLRQAV